MTITPARKLETFEGYIGRDREIRTTRPNPEDPFGRTREYACLSVAYRRNGRRRARPDWRTLVIWNVDAGPLHTARLCRKGDRVQVTAYRQDYTFTDDQGMPRTLRRFIVTDLRPVALKCPEYP
jgi:single-stranded DNA-binding protein